MRNVQLLPKGRKIQRRLSRLSSSAFSFSVLRSLIRRMQLNLTYLSKKLLPTAYLQSIAIGIPIVRLSTHLAQISADRFPRRCTLIKKKKNKTRTSCSFFDVSLRRSCSVRRRLHLSWAYSQLAVWQWDRGRGRITRGEKESIVFLTNAFNWRYVSSLSAELATLLIDYEVSRNNEWMKGRGRERDSDRH